MIGGDEIVVSGKPVLNLVTSGAPELFMRVGEEPNIEALSVTENGTYTPTGDGFNPVTVNVQPDLETLSATANGSYTPTGDGFSEVTVNVEPDLETLTATANGSYTPSGDGYSAVTVAIPTYDGSYTVTPTTEAQTLETSGKVMTGDVTVEGYEEPTLISKTITENGTFTASDEGADGYSEVTVNVAGSDDLLAAILDRSVTEIDSDAITSIGYMGLSNCSNLTRLSLSNCTGLSAYSLNSCTKIATYYLPKLTSIGGNAVIISTVVTTLVFPSLSSIGNSGVRGCTVLETVDMLGGSNLRAGVFGSCPNLKTLIFRSANSVTALYRLDEIETTCFGSSGTGGTLYVPQSMITSYQADSKWATLLGYANNQILPIEGSIYETQYADGTAV